MSKVCCADDILSDSRDDMLLRVTQFLIFYSRVHELQDRITTHDEDDREVKLE